MYLLVVTAASQNESLSKALNAPWQINLIAKIAMPHRGSARSASENESLSQALHNAPWQINLITKIEMPHRGFTGCQGVC